MDKPFALLIEDDRDVAALFRHVLDMAGYRSESVYDGLEAMKRLSNSQPDVVLLDLQLPGLSGVDILQKMRADERMKTIPVIVISLCLCCKESANRAGPVLTQACRYP